MQNLYVDGEGVKWQREVIGGGYVDPGAPITNFNDRGGGLRQRFIFYTKKNHNFRMCLLKKVITFFSIPKIYLNLFFITQKIPGHS